jgi:hypothetical protein
MKPPDWYPDWRGQVCVIVGSGPSAQGVDLTLARGQAKVIAINNSWQLAPWADALYACDAKWWHVNKAALAEFAGLKVTQATECPPVVHRVLLVQSAALATKPGYVGSGSNSGFQASNLAVQFGATTLIWVGFDMRIDRGLHWHGEHRNGLANPRPERVQMWRDYLDGAAPEFARLGVRVINASEVSALRNYPKMSLAEALQTAGAKP